MEDPADISETCDLEQLEGYLVAIDFKKAFDSLNHNFLTSALEHYGFGNYFIECVKILLKNPEILCDKRCHNLQPFLHCALI